MVERTERKVKNMNYDFAPEPDSHYRNAPVRVRLPHDEVDPAELAGPIRVYRMGEEYYENTEEEGDETE